MVFLLLLSGFTFDMDQDIKYIAECYKLLYNPNYKFNDNYGLVYISIDSYNSICSTLSYLRRVKEIDSHTSRLLRDIFYHLYKNENKIRELDSMQPRLIAQKFIGKRKIREYIFKRDKYRCLKCGTMRKLTIDHINPLYIGGENKLSNLQTLCRSCNSNKGINFKDYRNGAR